MRAFASNLQGVLEETGGNEYCVVPPDLGHGNSRKVPGPGAFLKYPAFVSLCGELHKVANNWAFHVERDLEQALTDCCPVLAMAGATSSSALQEYAATWAATEAAKFQIAFARLRKVLRMPGEEVATLAAKLGVQETPSSGSGGQDSNSSLETSAGSQAKVERPMPRTLALMQMTSSSSAESIGGDAEKTEEQQQIDQGEAAPAAPAARVRRSSKRLLLRKCAELTRSTPPATPAKVVDTTTDPPKAGPEASAVGATPPPVRRSGWRFGKRTKHRRAHSNPGVSPSKFKVEVNKAEEEHQNEDIEEVEALRGRLKTDPEALKREFLERLGDQAATAQSVLDTGKPLNCLDVFVRPYARVTRTGRELNGTALCLGLDHDHDFNARDRQLAHFGVLILQPVHPWYSWPRTLALMQMTSSSSAESSGGDAEKTEEQQQIDQGEAAPAAPAARVRRSSK
ncbi:MAG: hypothetical protein GY772_05210, partial [bacterium]|nr:hypothetical protein [bacterium]